MAKTAWVVYNKDGAIKAKRVPEGRTVEELSFFIRNTIGGTPIRAVQAETNAMAKRLASASPGSTEEIEAPEDRSTIDRAADLAARYGISPEDALDEVSKRPQSAQAYLEGKEPSWKDELSDFLTAIPRSMYAALPSEASYEERLGEKGLQSNPSLLPTVGATALSWPLSLPAGVLATGATQIGTEALLDPEYNDTNALLDAGALVPFATIPAVRAIPGPVKQQAAKQAGRIAKAAGNFVEKEVNKIPFGEVVTKPARYAVEKVADKVTKPAEGQLDLFSATNKRGAVPGSVTREEILRDLDVLARMGLPVERALLEENTRANYLPETNGYIPFIKYPGLPNRPVTPAEDFLFYGNMDALNSEEDN